MNKRKLLQYSFVVMATTICFIAGCTKYEDPAPIYATDVAYRANPSISSLLPGDTASVGVREISILGENFSTNIPDNQLYFNKSIATIKSATPTKLVVYRPVIFGDSVTVKVVVNGALSVNTYSKFYKIKQPIYPYDSRDIRNASFTNKIYCVDIDKDENDDQPDA